MKLYDAFYIFLFLIALVAPAAIFMVFLYIALYGIGIPFEQITSVVILLWIVGWLISYLTIERMCDEADVNLMKVCRFEAILLNIFWPFIVVLLVYGDNQLKPKWFILEIMKNIKKNKLKRISKEKSDDQL